MSNQSSRGLGEGYKGQGTVVAIIDSGLDVDHDVLHITDPSKAKYKSQEEMDAAKAAAGITYGKWFNDKVIFGYNYVDGNTNLKEGIEDSHGMHVTGIAAGTQLKKLEMSISMVWHQKLKSFS